MEEKEITDLFDKYKSNIEIFHDLMEFRVKEILLVATVYDAFILEQDGRLTERIFGEYSQLNLTTAPRITSVSNGRIALEILKEKQFDMVVLTMRIDEMSPFELAKRIRKINKDISIKLLLNDNRLSLTQVESALAYFSY